MEIKSENKYRKWRVPQDISKYDERDRKESVKDG
jgi:hypothetical protein